MKKWISLLLVMLLLPVLAAAEDFTASDLTGEWFSAYFSYNDEGNSAKLEENGDLTITYGEITTEVIRADGTYDEGDGVLRKLKRIDLSDGSFLLYDRTDYECLMLMFIPTGENKYNELYYRPDIALYYSGRKIGTNSSSEEYFVIDDVLYFVTNPGYTRGTVTRLADGIFRYDYTDAASGLGEKYWKLFVHENLFK